jgi:hypothetical protein
LVAYAIRRKEQLWHANMPNVRIAAGDFTIAVSSRISRLQYHLYDQLQSCEPSFAHGFAMTVDPSVPATAASPRERKPLTPAAKRALAEAEARRKAAEANARPVAKEFQGPKGPEPTRYGDWENKGIASDF